MPKNLLPIFFLKLTATKSDKIFLLNNFVAHKYQDSKDN